jgi:hypothetical protein
MRISLMTLQRLVATGSEEPQSAMVDAGLPRLIRIRSAQTWSDEDIPDLLESLDDSLNTSVAAMSSFEKYRAEVLSGALDWTPMHTNKQFWVVCVLRMMLHSAEFWCCLHACHGLLRPLVDRNAAVADTFELRVPLAKRAELPCCLHPAQSQC